MCGTFEPCPSPLMGEGSGGGEDSPSSPPSRPSPAEGGRGLDLALSTPRRGMLRVGVRKGVMTVRRHSSIQARRADVQASQAGRRRMAPYGMVRDFSRRSP
jgi:hypothetical protein